MSVLNRIGMQKRDPNFSHFLIENRGNYIVKVTKGGWKGGLRETFLLPDDSTVQRGLGELLVVISVVEHFHPFLGLDLEAMRGPCAESRDIQFT